MIKKHFFLTIVLITVLFNSKDLLSEQLFPLEFKQESIPVNGNDVVENPIMLEQNYGFSSTFANKLIEHGDSIVLTDKIKAIETPHTTWASPYAGGRIRVLAICHIMGLRFPVELRNRSDFEIETLIIPKTYKQWPKETTPNGYAFFKERFLTLLRKDWDVIILNLNDNCFKFLDKHGNQNIYFYEELKKKIENGTGLVLLQGVNYPQKFISDQQKKLIDEISPLKYTTGYIEGVPERTKTISPITESFSLPLLGNTGIIKCKAGKDAEILANVNGQEFLAINKFGKGRVVALNNIPPKNSQSPYLGIKDDSFEPQYALYLKAITWAANKEPNVSLVLPDIINCKSREKLNVPIAVKNLLNSPQSMILHYRLKDPYGVILQNKTLKLETKKISELKLDLQTLVINGMYRLDLILKDDRDKVFNWGCCAISVTGGLKFKVTQMPGKITRENGIYFHLDSDCPDDSTLMVKAIDDMERIFFIKEFKVEKNKEIEIDLSASCLPRARIEFSLKKNNEILARNTQIIYVPWIGQKSTGENFIISVAAPWTSEYLRPYVGALLREMGINTCDTGSTLPYQIKDRSADLGLYCVAGPVGNMRLEFKALKPDNIIRRVCPSNPRIKKKWDKIAKIDNELIRKYGGIARRLDDEVHFTDVKIQTCQCEYCIKCFQDKMKKKYKDIKKLNDAWGTNYPDFDSVKVIEEKEIKSFDNPSGWMEFRHFQNGIFANNYYGFWSKAHKELAEDFYVGCGYPYWVDRFSGPIYKGGDYSQLKGVIKYIGLYGGVANSIFRDSFISLPGGQKYDPPMEWKQHGPWNGLFNGADGLWYYVSPLYLGGEIAWHKHAEWLKQGITDIVNGCGILVSKAKPINRKVRILYSAESLAMAYLLSSEKNANNAFRLQSRTYVDSGLPLTQKNIEDLLRNVMFTQPSLVMSEDIKKGDLNDCELLILPQLFCMDDETASAIRDFVRNGGKVLADIMPATRDEFGKLLKKSKLDDIFGVDSSNSKFHKETQPWYSVGIGYLYENGKWSNEKGSWPGEQTWLQGNLTTLGIKINTAKAGGVFMSNQSGKAEVICPTLLCNNYGKGKTMLLNFLYRDFDAVSCNYHKIFGEGLFEWANIKTPVKILNSKTGAQLAYRPLYTFKRGNAILLGSIRGNLIWSGSRPILYDSGRALDSHDNTADLVRICFNQKKHIYNVRKGKYLGYSDSAKINLPSYHGILLALLPYQVMAVDTELPEIWQRGKTLKFSVSIKTTGTSAKEHVLRMEVISPSGYKNILYCKTVTVQNGKGELNIPFAYNDRPGIWQVRVRDVMSGITNEKEITLK
jgi:hypothetical protein